MILPEPGSMISDGMGTRENGCKNLLAILLRDRDLVATNAQHPHVLQYTPVFPRYLIQLAPVRYRSSTGTKQSVTKMF